MSGFLAYFLSIPGLVVLALLDATVLVFLPLALDFVLVLMVANDPERFWLYPLLAVAGSVLGALGTWWLGQRLGEEGLGRLVSEARLERVRNRVEDRGAVALGSLSVIPPPFPYTAFVLVAGAIEARLTPFLAALAGGRLVRFGLEAWLASRYGRRITAWMETSTFEIVVAGFIVAAVLGTGWSVTRLFRRAG